MSNHPSNSQVQQDIGKELVKIFFSKLGAPLEQERALPLGIRREVNIDGYSKDPPILCKA